MSVWGMGFLLFHLIFLFFSFSGFSLILSFDVFELLGEFFSLVFFFDWVSFLFLRVVSLISGVVIFYSIFYIGEMGSLRFFYLLVLFVVSMFFLIFRGNLIFIMLGWDGLGVVSFALVIYYQNEVRVKRGLITIFINRLGDAAMVFFICICLFSSLNYQVMGTSNDFWLIVMLFILGCFTKSAQFPFMSWLPAAMTAPTPISSLVHSSTLVTAGVYLLIRMNLFFSDDIIFSVCELIGISTMGIGGLMALAESDLKKVVAFSTLRQLGLIVFVFRFGEWQLSFFHLLTHAIFKSFLFMVVGCVITMGYGNQDRRLIGLNLFNRWIIQIFVGFACLNLRGFPLTIGFLSKDAIIESLLRFGGRFLSIFLFCFFCCFTVGYRFKIFFYCVGFMRMGNSLLFGYSFSGPLGGLIFLFYFLCFWGLIVEEIVLFEDLFVSEQDAKILDVFIILGGIALYFFYRNVWANLGINVVLDFFWLRSFFFYISCLYGLISHFLRGVVYYFVNFFVVDIFRVEYVHRKVISDVKMGVRKIGLILGFIFITLFIAAASRGVVS